MKWYDPTIFGLMRSSSRERLKKDLFRGKKESLKQLPTLSSRQQRRLDDLLSGIDKGDLDIGKRGTYKAGRNYLTELLSGSPEAMEAFEAPYMRQFEEEIIPMIAQRFSGLGEGAQQSSGFQHALTRSATDLQERLAALRGGMQMQALPQALQYAQAPGESAYRRMALGLGTSPYTYFHKPGQKSAAGSFFQQGMQAAPYAALAML